MEEKEIKREDKIDKKKSSVWMMVLYIVVAAIIFGGIGYLIGKNKSDATETNEAVVETTVTSDLSPTTSITSTSTASTSAVASTDVFSVAKLREASVTIGTSNYQLSGGSYTNSSAGEDVPSSITLDESNIAIDSANTNQAAIILKVQYGGNGVSKVLEIMGNKGGNPQDIANTLLNEGQVAVIQNLSFNSGTIAIGMLVLGPNDSQSSPSVSKNVS